jgi:hypothetical protein
MPNFGWIIFDQSKPASAFPLMDLPEVREILNKKVDLKAWNCLECRTIQVRSEKAVKKCF